MIKKIGCFIALLFGISKSSLAQSSVFPYQMLEPKRVLTLDKELVEISGLGLSADGKELIAVQDEKGKIFRLDKKKGKIIGSFDFWKKGDYEGVEIVGRHIFVVKSTGTIYKIDYPDQKNQKVEKLKFFLSKDNDVEGLCYDKARNRLLVACKAKAGSEEKFLHQKGIYSLDLGDMQLSKEPTYVVSLEEVQDYLATDPMIRKLEKVMEFFQPSESGFTFAPSAIAIHPKSGHIYITSAVGKLLLVMDTAGKILHIENLKKSLHAQPEGICFDEDGTLYIANEGKNKKGKILVYKMK